MSSYSVSHSGSLAAPNVMEFPINLVGQSNLTIIRGYPAQTVSVLTQELVAARDAGLILIDTVEASPKIEQESEELGIGFIKLHPWDLTDVDYAPGGVCAYPLNDLGTTGPAFGELALTMIAPDYQSFELVAEPVELGGITRIASKLNPADYNGASWVEVGQKVAVQFRHTLWQDWYSFTSLLVYSVAEIGGVVGFVRVGVIGTDGELYPTFSIGTGSYVVSETPLNMLRSDAHITAWVDGTDGGVYWRIGNVDQGAVPGVTFSVDNGIGFGLAIDQANDVPTGARLNGRLYSGLSQMVGVELEGLRDACGWSLVPSVRGPQNPVAGKVFEVTGAGTYLTVPYNVGDWVVRGLDGVLRRIYNANPVT